MGFELIARNFSSPCGEIDPIMRNAKHIAFIAARYRRNDRFGGAVYSVTATQRRKLKRFAALFVSRQKPWSCCPCPFDVIAYDAPNGDG